MEEKYTRYGIDWQNEVMKNPKMMIVQMLRRVAMERDELYAAQHHAHLTQTVERTAHRKGTHEKRSAR